MFLCQYENNYLEIFSLNNEFNFIFYENNVVVTDKQLLNDKNGGRTSLFLTSQRMPSRYKCVHMLIQLCKYIHAVSSVGSHPDAWDIDTYTIVSDDI